MDYDTLGEGLHVAVCRENRTINTEDTVSEINTVLEITGTKMADD